MVTRDLMMPTPRQIVHPLLCGDCEQLLNRMGESWVLPLLAKIDSTFPLLDVLTRQQGTVVGHDMSLYALAQNPDARPDLLTHFAIGIFWKAAVYSWRGGRDEPRIDLEGREEDLRRFLLGEAPFPEDMALVAQVNPKPSRFIAFHLPMKAGTHGADGGIRKAEAGTPGILDALTTS
jgi:hypothetical protein